MGAEGLPENVCRLLNGFEYLDVSHSTGSVLGIYRPHMEIIDFGLSNSYHDPGQFGMNCDYAPTGN